MAASAVPSGAAVLDLCAAPGTKTAQLAAAPAARAPDRRGRGRGAPRRHARQPRGASGPPASTWSSRRRPRAAGVVRGGLRRRPARRALQRPRHAGVARRPALAPPRGRRRPPRPAAAALLIRRAAPACGPAACSPTPCARCRAPRRSDVVDALLAEGGWALDDLGAALARAARTRPPAAACSRCRRRTAPAASSSPGCGASGAAGRMLARPRAPAPPEPRREPPCPICCTRSTSPRPSSRPTSPRSARRGDGAQRRRARHPRRRHGRPLRAQHHHRPAGRGGAAAAGARGGALLDVHLMIEHPERYVRAPSPRPAPTSSSSTRRRACTSTACSA